MSFWRICAAHHVAHLQPTLTLGTEDVDYPLGNVRTLDPNVRSRITATATTPSQVQIDFDRGTGSLNEINCLILAGGTSNSNGQIKLIADTGSGFATPTTLLTLGVYNMNPNTPRMITFPANSERYVRFELQITTVSFEWELGMLSLGHFYELNLEMFGENNVGSRDVLVDGVVTKRFSKVDTDDVIAIMNDWRSRYVLDTDNAVIDGFGCWGRRRPVALAEFTTQDETTDSAANVCHYGPADLRSVEDLPSDSSLSVRVDNLNIGVVQ